MENLRFVDLFCGIGGFRTAMEQTCKKINLKTDCVFSSDIDEQARISYEINYGHKPAGDITKIKESDIPDHDILFAGFPCQPFSIIGQRKGFEDTRGTLFFDIARILNSKQPKAFILENVKQLAGHNSGHTLRVIIKTLKDLGYTVYFKVLNALNYGLPQKRERVIIVGHKEPILFTFPDPLDAYVSLEEILETKVDPKYFASERIREKRFNAHKSSYFPSIWHENKSGNISSYPFSCALRAGASYNYLLVNGERRLTPREMLRLQGFPDTFKVVVNDSQIRKQVGNAVPINVIRAVLLKLLPFVAKSLDEKVYLREPLPKYSISNG